MLLCYCSAFYWTGAAAAANSELRGLSIELKISWSENECSFWKINCRRLLPLHKLYQTLGEWGKVCSRIFEEEAQNTDYAFVEMRKPFLNRHKFRYRISDWWHHNFDHNTTATKLEIGNWLIISGENWRK